MKTAIITDSSANLTEETLKKYDHLFVLPLMIIIDGKNYRDQVDITADEVYNKLDAHKITTSLPSLEDLSSLLEDLKKKGYTDLLVINISSGLSGTFNAFRLFFNEVKDFKITHYDSKTLAASLGYLVEHAADLVIANKTPKQIVPLLDKLRYEDSIAFYTIDTLKYLRKGGRIGKVEGTIGNILRVKPVITVSDEGVYETLSKSWGLQRALLTMKKLLQDKFGDATIDLTIHYGDDAEKAKELGAKLRAEFNVRNLTLSKLTPVLGIHTGPMMFAYVARQVR